MKVKNLTLISALLAGSLLFASCSDAKDFILYWASDGEYGKKENIKEEEVEETTIPATEETTEETLPLIFLPEQSEVDAICQLATLDCYYHNVARSIKSAGTGVEHMGERDRKFWIEYDAYARVGIDVNQLQMSINEETNEITIILPKAMIVGAVNADPNSYNINSYIEEPDTSTIANWTVNSINKNPITSTDVTEAIAESLLELETEIMNDAALLNRARERAKDLITSYIEQLAEMSDVEYTINWVYIENVNQ